MAPRISGKGVKRKCYFCCCCLQGPDVEQVEQSTVMCEDVGSRRACGRGGVNCSS